MSWPEVFKSPTKGVCNLSNQLSTNSKIWGTKRGKTKFHEFHEVILPRFCFPRTKMATIPTNFTGTDVKFVEISLETIIWEN